MTFAVYNKQFPDELIGAVRTALIASAIAGIVLGLIAVIWPGITVMILGVLFGIALIVGGIFRVSQAFAASYLSGGIRTLLGLLGVLTIIVGVFALFSPASDAVWLLALFIGIGWIFQGVNDLFAAASKSAHVPTWYLVFSGIISVLAGIVMIIAGQFALTVFVWVGGIMLIVLSIATLFTLPKKVDTPAV
ncbi:DUF308 domain-containing protein [Gordonia desulfuricans]|uniref:DUF308 domain-containing protein n=1 Tax=Gordonia desulfuricans TaxID=89051 RepID=A0A7K3LL25_9ACTN|nr:DUF308 domain-containing protein [Gordonia desulfuricans]NDK88946.1 DUF308 domain-containing protein [Gordonia desulfuricans]